MFHAAIQVNSNQINFFNTHLTSAKSAAQQWLMNQSGGDGKLSTMNAQIMNIPISTLSSYVLISGNDKSRLPRHYVCD